MGGNGLTRCQKVIGVALPRANLHGPLTQAIGALTELRSLNLRGNQLVGVPPESLGHLTKLSHLDLSRNPNLRAPSNRGSEITPFFNFDDLPEFHGLGLEPPALRSYEDDGPLYVEVDPFHVPHEAA
jgi:hypothetical protein